MIKENILVSHNQIIIRSVPYDPERQRWNENNIEDGIIWYKNYIVLDPLVDGSFGCWFHINQKEKLQLSTDSIRAALIPFEIKNPEDFSINTVSESVKLYRDTTINISEEQEKGNYYPLNANNRMNFESGTYSILFEICLGIPDESVHEEEVYYKFTFIQEESPVFKVLKEDEYGWNSKTYLDEKKRKLENIAV